MFQAINLTNPRFYHFFLLILFSSLAISANPGKERLSCSLIDSKTPFEYFLSRAYLEQRSGFHKTDLRKPEEAKKHHEAAVLFFQKFHTCRSENKLGPTYLSALSLANSYLELADLENALLWSEQSYQMFQSPDVVPREAILLKTRILLRKGDLEAAGNVLSSNLKHYPFDFDFLYYLGNIYYDLKQWNRSILHFIALSDVIEKRDTNSKLKPTVLKFLGDLNYRLDYQKKSIYHYDRYLSFAGNDLDVQFRIAQLYFTLGEFGLSKKYLTSIRSANPREIDASSMLGEMYFIDSRAFAMGYFQQLKVEKKLSQEGILKYISKYLNGEEEGLLELVSQFVAKNPNRLSARILHSELIPQTERQEYYKSLVDAGALSYQYRQYKTAENLFSKALEFALMHKDFEREVVSLYEKRSQCKEAQKKIQSSILDMRKAIELSTDLQNKADLKYRLAYLLIHEKVNKHIEALKISDDLIKAYPNQASYHYLKGAIYLQKENHKLALGSFKKAVELEPKNPNYLFYTAICYDKLGDFKSTEKLLLNAIDISPESSNSYNYLGYLYAERNLQKEESERLLLKATDLEPDNAAYQDSLGWIYFRQNRIPESLLHLHFAEQISIERDAQDSVIYDHLGDVYRKSLDLVKAEFYFNKALLYSNGKDPKEIAKINTKLVQIQKELNQ
ncbi:MAG: tetratricopeptide repeat protein [Leptospira sp.]|nr:tetratricopeptide repeat protein [Leptospira sp.]